MSSLKANGSWPYHESTRGEMVPCKSNPCKLHSDDIYASSPEEAYERKYAGAGIGMHSSSHAGNVRSRTHSRPVDSRRFSRLKKTAVSFMMLAVITSGLSACGSNTDSNAGNDNNAGSDSSYSRQLTEEDVRRGADTAKKKVGELYNKAKDAYNSDTGKSYRDKAKKATQGALSALDGYLSNGSSFTPVADGDVPAYLNASPDVTMADLQSLKVVPDHSRRYSYNRKDYSNSTWENMNGSSCWSVRDEVIKRQADPGTLKITPDGCAVESVTMTDPYTGEKMSFNSKKEVQAGIQIDHVVPVAYADSNGASSWDSALKTEYYNDLDPGHLLAVSSHENTSKSDKGPNDYMLSSSAPSSFTKAYAQDWVKIIKDYNSKSGNMTIEQSDYDAILRVFQETGVQ